MDFDVKDPVVQVMLVIILLTIGGAYYGFNYILKPLELEVNGKEEELSKLQNELDRVRAVADRLELIKEEVEKLDERWKEVSSKLPSRKQIARLLVQLTNAAVSRNLVLQEFRPEPVSSGVSAVVESHPVQIQGTATFHDLAEFFADVANFKRIMQIDRVSIRPARKVTSAGEVHNIQVGFTVTAYAFKEGVGPVGGGEDDEGWE